MAVENRCGLGVRRVDKYSQSHIWTDDGRTLGRAFSVTSSRLFSENEFALS
jgi:hypothetical protein